MDTKLERFGLTHRFINEKIWSTVEVTPREALLTDLIIFTGVIVASILFYFLVKIIIIGMVRQIVKKSKNDWDDELLKGKILIWVALFIPTIIIWKGGERAFMQNEHQVIISKAGEVFIILLGFLTFNSLLNLCERIYRRHEFSRKFPIKGFIQVIKIVLTICCSIFIISAVIDKNPLSLFAGLGAMSAVLMFIFKDSILGLVAGIQLSANQMVARGDWIEVPKFGADGEVLEVALTTVKVRNWDKTITTLPTYSLISDSFKNWRGMSNSKVRRIKRKFILDLQSVKFVDNSMLEKYRKVNLLKDYLAEKEKEVEEWNKEKGVSSSDIANARILTNIGTFRAYILQYLKTHPQIQQDETVMVRQLQASEYGLPLELYVFCSDNRWVQYEDIQADIFDHIYSVMSEFDLVVYQRPSNAALLNKDH